VKIILSKIRIIEQFYLSL